jgi:hypothetical protein
MNKQSGLGGPTGQIVGIIGMSIGAGTVLMTVVEFFARGDSMAWLWVLVFGVLIFGVVANAMRLRKTIP